MKLTQLIDDDRGVSPVIGVILMVAITVILAAVIGTFVLGLGSNVGNNAPQASFNFEQVDDSNEVDVTMQTGDAIDVTSADVTVQNADSSTDSNSFTVSDGTEAKNVGDEGEWTSGETVTGAVGAGDGDEIQVVWSSGDQSSIIGSGTI